MSSGILYIATGDEFIKQAVISAEYVDELVDLPIAIVAHRDIEHPVFDEVIVDPNPTYSYLDKARNLQNSRPCLDARETVPQQLSN